MTRYESIVAYRKARRRALLERVAANHRDRWAHQPYRVANRAVGMPGRHDEEGDR
jgi:hypothetical protein